MEEDELGNVFRGRKRRADGTLVIEFVDPEHPEHMGEEQIRAHEEVTKVKNVNSLQLGRHRMDTWYFSAIPPEFWHTPEGVESYIDTLHVCEFCLKFFRHASELGHHATKCPLRHPPGDEVYRGGDGIGMWELDGAREKQYCQNLAYIAKMFLDHKTLKFDVDPFLFYVMTERTPHGHAIVGYFSKEKWTDTGNNLSCILALPCHQRKGYGRFLIEFSYELSKIEQKAGHPETPLSDLGLLSYTSFWSSVILAALLQGPAADGEEVSLVDLMVHTSISLNIIENVLRQLDMLRLTSGEGGGEAAGSYVIVVDKAKAAAKLAKLTKPGPRVDPQRIHWAPLPPVPKDKWKIPAIKMSCVQHISAQQTGGGGRGGE
jgi:histone acetyltransferase MYST1